jgi:hypothetical protein
MAQRNNTEIDISGTESIKYTVNKMRLCSRLFEEGFTERCKTFITSKSIAESFHCT